MLLCGTEHTLQPGKALATVVVIERLSTPLIPHTVYVHGKIIR